MRYLIMLLFVSGCSTYEKCTRVEYKLDRNGTMHKVYESDGVCIPGEKEFYELKKD